MDGFKRQINHSLQRRLAFWLSAVIVLVAAVAGAFSFFSAFNEANELQDNTLRQIAALFDRQALTPAADEIANAPASDEETRVVVQHLADSTLAKHTGDDGLVLPLDTHLPEGLHTINIEGETFRVLVKTTHLGERIAVAQETGVRDAAARESALRSVMPLMLLVPLLLLLLANLVRKMFQPITALATELDHRSESDLQHVNAGSLPAEVLPFAAAINRLLGRVEKSVQVQQRFVADAAHELRSPLTALSLQAERMAQLPLEPEATHRLQILRGGIDRSRRLLEQLLALAKMQSSSAHAEADTLVGPVLVHVLEDCMPMAQAKHMDIGLVDVTDFSQVRAPVTALDLTILVRNLLDNAIRYTPNGGRIDLWAAWSGSVTTLRVTDSGPGIASIHHSRVLEPFCRLPVHEESGSGLGLSIVNAIVQRTGGTLELGFTDASHQTGLSIQVCWPQLAAPAPAP